MRSRGFTLVELLISISIVAILAVLGLTGYSYFLKSARDAKRQSDLKLIQSALEAYHADHIYYPASITFGEQLADGSKTYLTKIPSDPKEGQQYIYSPKPAGCTGTGCMDYCLYAKLETSTTDQYEVNCSSPPETGYNFSVTKP